MQKNGANADIPNIGNDEGLVIGGNIGMLLEDALGDKAKSLPQQPAQAEEQNMTNTTTTAPDDTATTPSSTGPGETVTASAVPAHKPAGRGNAYLTRFVEAPKTARIVAVLLNPPKAGMLTLDATRVHSGRLIIGPERDYSGMMNPRAFRGDLQEYELKFNPFKIAVGHQKDRSGKIVMRDGQIGKGALVRHTDGHYKCPRCNQVSPLTPKQQKELKEKNDSQYIQCWRPECRDLRSAIGNSSSSEIRASYRARMRAVAERYNAHFAADLAAIPETNEPARAEFLQRIENATVADPEYVKLSADMEREVEKRAGAWLHEGERMFWEYTPPRIVPPNDPVIDSMYSMFMSSRAPMNELSMYPRVWAVYGSGQTPTEWVPNPQDALAVELVNRLASRHQTIRPLRDALDAQKGLQFPRVQSLLMEATLNASNQPGWHIGWMTPGGLTGVGATGALDYTCRYSGAPTR